MEITYVNQKEFTFGEAGRLAEGECFCGDDFWGDVLGGERERLMPTAV